MADSKLDLGALRSAVASLENGLEVVRDTSWFTQQTSKVQNTLIAGVIHNFEFVYVVDWATTSASFRQIMERDRMVVQEGSRRSNQQPLP